VELSWAKAKDFFWASAVRDLEAAPEAQNNSGLPHLDIKAYTILLSSTSYVNPQTGTFKKKLILVHVEEPKVLAS
jgi:hypothetical protein